MMSQFIRSFLLIALVLSFTAGCATPGKRTGIGAGAGAGAGAAIGGAAGGWKGAGIGAAAGAAVGAAVGNYLDKQYNELERVTDAKRLKNGILIDLKNDLLFPTGSSELKAEAVRELSEVGRILAKYKEDRVRVTGHTDNVGAADFNSELSRRRASAVREVLEEQGVQDEQLIVAAFGESKPVAANSSASGRSQNRRVELLIDVPANNRVPAQKSDSR